MKFRCLILLLTSLAAGCAHEPFVRPPLPLLSNPDPTAIRAEFAHSAPDRFISDDTIIIDAPFNHDFAFLGVMSIDRPAGKFEFVALNQVGLKLFQLAGHGQDIEIQYALGPLQNHKDILTAIGQDLHRMYFDLVPGQTADVDIGKTKITFAVKSSDGDLEYKFGGDPAVLLEKRLSGFFGTIWRAQYFQYQWHAGTLYPRGIVMDNSRYHYRIIVKNRDREIR